jgi:hypothetical protein
MTEAAIRRIRAYARALRERMERQWHWDIFIRTPQAPENKLISDGEAERLRQQCLAHDRMVQECAEEEGRC